MSFNQRLQRQTNGFLYTHNLPYGTRRYICNLLDADQSWRTLGGQFMGLDATQLTLVGQAYLRNGSPTDELLNRLDSANARTSELCFYLQQMNHCRALEILKPYLMDGEPDSELIRVPNQQETAGIRGIREDYKLMNGSTGNSRSTSSNNNNNTNNSTLDTPTPSFAEQPAAIMGYPEQALQITSDLQESTQQQPSPTRGLANGYQYCNPPSTACHNSKPPPTQVAKAEQPAARPEDPGEEIVRMACANNRKRTSISDQEVVNQLRLIMQITYNELKQASNDFSDSNILGNGGFASVYRGNWKGTDVAIKRLKCNLMDQALNELTILNSYRIDNILPIYGISIDGPEACLVYQFMANGSLEDRLSCKKGSRPLSWQQRAQIGEGVAKGLYYLHTLRDKPLVHGDVKSANVLLDAQFVPKLGDFGLARQVFKGRNPQTELCTHCTVSSIHGTSVYLPPEYLRHKILSPAVDVYSYGTVLLEMATGRRAYDGKRLLIDLVEDETRCIGQGQISYSLKDSRLQNDTQAELRIWYQLLIKLGLDCVHKIKKKRPDMGQVLSRFADFRQSGELTEASAFPDQSDKSVCPVNGTGTPVPENPIDHHYIQQQQNKRLPPVCSNNSAALMSVEEECELPANCLQQAAGNGNRICAPEVEAMIPLITELGIATSGQIE